MPTVLAASIASAAIAGVLVWVILQPLGSEPALVRSVVSAAPSLPPHTGPPGDDVTITPDGESIIYGVRVDNDRQIYLRPVDRLEGTALTGTGIAVSPFVSPDGGWVGFYDLQARAAALVAVSSGLSRWAASYTGRFVGAPGFPQGKAYEILPLFLRRWPFRGSICTTGERCAAVSGVSEEATSFYGILSHESGPP